MKRNLSSFNGLAFAIAALLLLPFFSCHDVRDEPLPSCENIHWEYEGFDGPDYWGQLCVDYTACAGQVQSPVNISGATDDAGLGQLMLNDMPSTTHITNNGHTLQWTYDAGSTLILNGTTYQLLQFHSHTPSEHTVNGVYYPLELHFVHKNDATGKLAVIGVLVEEGAENAFLKPFLDHLPAAANEKFDAATTYNVADFFPANKSYFTYSGSLTTPPCSEIVTWIVLEHPVEASVDQIHQFEQIEHENNRPLQPLNGRVIHHFNE